MSDKNLQKIQARIRAISGQRVEQLDTMLKSKNAIVFEVQESANQTNTYTFAHHTNNDRILEMRYGYHGIHGILVTIHGQRAFGWTWDQVTFYAIEKV